MSGGGGGGGWNKNVLAGKIFEKLISLGGHLLGTKEYIALFQLFKI